jgi:hypothetical protein
MAILTHYHTATPSKRLGARSWPTFRRSKMPALLSSRCMPSRALACGRVPMRGWKEVPLASGAVFAKDR